MLRTHSTPPSLGSTTDNDWLLHSDAPNAFSLSTILRRLDQPNNEGDQWFSDADDRGADLALRDGDIRGNTMVFVGGADGEYLPIYRFNGAPGANAPEYCYHRNGPSGRFEGPVFSPDATALAWGEADGIWIGPVGDQSGARCQEAGEQRHARDPRRPLPGLGGARTFRRRAWSSPAPECRRESSRPESRRRESSRREERRPSRSSRP